MNVRKMKSILYLHFIDGSFLFISCEILLQILEPPRDKTNNVAVRPAKTAQSVQSLAVRSVGS